jgi:sensor domain CHASE-containing protein
MELIPALSSGSTSYKDFKVIFNGSIEKVTSVKSFKWLSNCDTTQMDLKQEAKNAVTAVKENVKNQVEATKTQAKNIKNNVNKIVETQKQQVQAEKQAVEQAKTDIQNIKQNAGKSAVNLGKLLQNAASNANKKMEIPQTKTEQTVPAETKTETPQESKEEKVVE